MKQKIKLSLPASAKPRNPVCLAARQRHAGVHAPAHPERQQRRAEKQRLRHWLHGGGELD